MIQGKFYQKLKDVVCQLKQLEPCTPWLNASERKMELKIGTGCKLLWSRAQKCLCDDYLELEAYMRSNIDHEIFKLDREVSVTVMSGKTSDNS